MKLPRLITRRRLKWAGTVAAFVGLCTFGFSLFSETALYGGFSSTQNHFIGCDADAGRLRVYHISRASTVPLRSYVRLIEPRVTTDASFKPWFDWILGSTSEWIVIIPLWFPFLLIATPTAYLWHTDRRAKPWQCPKCRYDLRGLDGGVCPECGHELKPSNAEGVTG